VTALDTRPSTPTVLAPGSRGFIGILAMCMAITAVGVDAVLPAFPDIRDSLGLAEGATSVTALITVY
jgi:DHA1 family bicyclomycin/chloramphenicol resistance-like MFS transporter